MRGSMKFLEGDQLVGASNTNTEKSPKQGARRSLSGTGVKGGGAAEEDGTKRRDARGQIRKPQACTSCGEARPQYGAVATKGGLSLT
ncbi:hypothetical protein LX36DRAFT_655948 [Colletotrichum falcatum]|nr:hypothetical protein LX36DRAFT_655948 [Colletotrichum falcatum]